MPQPDSNWLVVGAGGMLATDLEAALRAAAQPHRALTQFDLDICDESAVRAAVADAQPRVIVNCAAYTQVDRCEEQEELAAAVNGTAVENLAGAADESGALLIQISTDFVFDGSANRPYEHDAKPSPLSAYGRTKLLGEQAAARTPNHLIVRTSWLFGRSGPNFVEAIRGQIANGSSRLRVVADQRGRPTATPSLSRALIRLANAALTAPSVRGVFHYADSPDCTWFDFARAIVEESGASTEVVPVTTDEYPRPAQRPAYSVLSTRRYSEATGWFPESWRENLRTYLRG